MNYFERLARRALLQPARRPGMPFDDPFERTADWPVDTPAKPAVTPAAPGEARPEAPEHMAPPVADPATEISISRLVESHETRTLREQVSGEPHEIPAPIARESEPVLPEAVEPPQRMSPPEPERPPLALADAFLARLGVRVPADAPDIEFTPKAPEVATPASARADSPEAVEVSGVVTPPLPPARQAPADREPDIDQAEVVAAAAVRQIAEETRHRPVTTTPQVIVIDRQPSSRRPHPVRRGIGVGAPHVGLGQL